MKEFLRNILPRIEKFSQKLDHAENFVGKPWALVEDGKSELLEYEFFRDGRLLVAFGGEASWGKWELAPSSHRLILEYNEKVLLLQTAFLNEAIMIVKKSGSSEPSMVFVDLVKIPDLLYTVYLERLAEENAREEKIREQEITKQKKINPVKPKATLKIGVSQKVFDEGDNLVEGKINVEEKPRKYKFFENEKEETWFVRSIKTSAEKTIFIKTRDEFAIEPGDQIFDCEQILAGVNPTIDIIIQQTDGTLFLSVNSQGVIINIYKDGGNNTLFIVAGVSILLLFLIILGNSL